MLGKFAGLKFAPDGTTPDLTQRLLQTMLRDLYSVQISGGNLVSVAFPASANTDKIIDHGLGRAPLGYFPVSLSLAGIVYTSPTVVKAPDRELILRCNAASLNALMWVF